MAGNNERKPRGERKPRDSHLRRKQAFDERDGYTQEDQELLEAKALEWTNTAVPLPRAQDFQGVSRAEGSSSSVAQAEQSNKHESTYGNEVISRS